MVVHETTFHETILLLQQILAIERRWKIIAGLIYLRTDLNYYHLPYIGRYVLCHFTEDIYRPTL